MIKNIFKLYLVTHMQDISFETYKKFILQVIEGGITAIQLREKNKSYAEILAVAKELKLLLTPYNIPLIINDHIQIAKEIDADGIHLGQTDTPTVYARKILGDKKIIGVSIESMQELEEANKDNHIDYVAASAVFNSTTKNNCKTIWGLQGLKQFTSKSNHPVIAIGGINQDNIQDVFKNGAHGAAIISALHYANNPKKTTEELIKKINEVTNV